MAREVASYQHAGSIIEFLIAVGRVIKKTRQLQLLRWMRPFIRPEDLALYDHDIFIWKATQTPRIDDKILFEASDYSVGRDGFSLSSSLLTLRTQS